MGHPQGAFQSAWDDIKRILLFVGLFSFCINVLMLVGPIYMLQVYDRVLSSGSLPTLLFLTVAAIGLILVSAILEAVRARVLVRLSGRADELLNEPLFTRLHEAALAGDTRAQPLRDLDTLRGFVTGQGLFFFFDAPWTPLFLAFVFLLHPLLFGVAISGAAILFAVAITSELATRTPLNLASGHGASATAFAETMLRNADSVEAMGMLPGLRSRWLERHRSSLSLQARASDVAGALTAIAKFVRPTLQVWILGAGAFLVLAQEITAGAMIAASIMMGRALAPIEGAISHWRGFVLARRSYRRVATVLSAPTRQVSSLPLPRPQGALGVDRLIGVAPGGGAPIIKGISFRLEPGEALGIIGPSAAGKSTLGRLLVGVWLPASGHVRLDGMEVGDWNHVELGRHVGYLPQEVELFEGTVAENIARFGKLDPTAIIEAARRAGAHDLILQLPSAYDTRVGGLGNTVLSGGQRQRIGLARALYGEPAFVVLDEPNSNLDSDGEEALRRTLTELKDLGTTAVVIAHRPSVLGVVDKLLVLRQGMIERLAPREEVLAPVPRPVPQKPTVEVEPRRATGELPAPGRVAKVIKPGRWTA